ncbi:hypothetical protein KSS87_008395 [Heliosperma pusillum]|nr:hypothetical protein KSS87_008395 [Heliosperma pusillum]
MFSRLEMMGLSAALPRVASRLVGTTATTRRFIGGYAGYAGYAETDDVDDYNHHLSSPPRHALPFTPSGYVRKKPVERMRMGPIMEQPNHEELNEQSMQPRVDLKENNDALRLKVELPGVNKENVKVYLEGPFLVMKGVRELEDDENESDPKSYSARLNLGPALHTYKIEGIKAELKSGILKVTIPKVKHEQRTDVFHVKVD